MSTLTLVRHGQASFFEDDYDQLSALGEKQSHRLGEYLAAREQRFDLVFVGPRRRHTQTAEAVAGVFRDAGADWPETILCPELDEHNAVESVARDRKRLGERFPHLTELEAQLMVAETPEGRKRAYGRLFTAVMDLWMQDQLEVPGLEPWHNFLARVRRGIDAIVAKSGRNQRVIAFTSGGPVAAAVQLALQGEERATLLLASRVANTSYTRFLFDGDRFSLDCFNGTGHLREPDLETHL
jgi:broad specificity phosphatase PhoE